MTRRTLYFLATTCALTVIQTVSAATNEFATRTADGWYQYQVPIAENAGSPCCQDRGTCALTNSPRNLTINKSLTSKNLVIYFKQGAQRVEDIVLAGEQCHVNTGNYQVKALNNMSDHQSLDMLKAVSSHTDQHLAITAIAAIALHRAAEATQILTDIAFDAQHRGQRDAIFWLGEAREQDGYLALRTIIDTTTQPVAVRKHAVFALSLSTHPEAKDTLKSLARAHPTQQIQKEAIFWYAESQQQDSTSLLTDLTGPTYPQSIQKEAVFGLSRLPSAQATQALIGLVRNTQSKTVRKTALFWLGQSSDQKAHQFITEVLTR